jgi:hypothetical protein
LEARGSFTYLLPPFPCFLLLPLSFLPSLLHPWSEIVGGAKEGLHGVSSGRRGLSPTRPAARFNPAYEHLRRTEHRKIWRFPKSPLAPRRRWERRLSLNA